MKLPYTDLFLGMKFNVIFYFENSENPFCTGYEYAQNFHTDYKSAVETMNTMLSLMIKVYGKIKNKPSPGNYTYIKNPIENLKANDFAIASELWVLTELGYRDLETKINEVFHSDISHLTYILSLEIASNGYGLKNGVFINFGYGFA